MKAESIAIIDYGMGNLRSVQKAFEACGAKPLIVSKSRDIEKADKVVLPGVGAFTHAISELKKLRLIDPLKEKVRSGTPYLGICLGLQLLFSESEEGGRVKGLDLISGPVVRFRGSLKTPHMGWNTVSILQKKCPLLKEISQEDYFYFVHSYYGVPDDKSWALTSTQYGKKFTSSVWKGNIFATQFHPEKSQKNGLTMIRNFINYRNHA